MSRPRLIALLLAFGTLLVFLPVGGFNFVNYDDPDYVTGNNFIKNGLTATDIHWAFTAYFSGNWHPLTWMSHMLDCQLFGPNAGKHHYENVFWHALNVALLFLWLTRLTGKMGPSAFIAALFAVHPLHVESVAWISERKDVLSTFFALLTLLAYTRYVQENKRGWLWAALGFFALGLLAKPMLVTLPFALLLLDYWPLQRLFPFTLAVLVEKIPFFALTAASCVVTSFAQHEAMSSLTLVSMHYRLENSTLSLVRYLGKLFMPIDLSVVYPMASHIPGWKVGLALAALIAISVVAWQWRRRRPYFLMGWLWYLGTLMPVIGLVQVGGQSMADRYMYIPSIGCLIALVFLLAEVAERMETPRVIMTGFAAVVCLACILVTEHQLQYWRDSETLFRRAVSVTTDNEIALSDLAVALDLQGRFAESLVLYRQAEKLADSRYQIHNNLGNILDKLGQPAASLGEYQRAVQLRPDDPALRNSAAMEMNTLGQYDDALKELAGAAQVDPKDPWSHLNQAKILFELGRDTSALQELQAAVSLAPDDYQILGSAAHYLAANDDPAARNGRLAVMLAAKANALSGNSQPMIFDILGMALAESGDFTNAQTCVQSALTLVNAAKMQNTDQLQQRLELYQKNQPWHESFRITNTPVKLQ